MLNLSAVKDFLLPGVGAAQKRNQCGDVEINMSVNWVGDYLELTASAPGHRTLLCAPATLSREAIESGEYKTEFMRTIDEFCARAKRECFKMPKLKTD